MLELAGIKFPVCQATSNRPTKVHMLEYKEVESISRGPRSIGCVMKVVNTISRTIGNKNKGCELPVIGVV